MSAVAAIVLAAGRASRMGFDKLTADLWGMPVVAHVVDALLSSRVCRVLVVVGDRERELRSALGERRVEFVRNGEFERGLSTSIRAGIRALAADTDASVVCLGDMPGVRAEHIDALIGAFERSGDQPICVPIHAGQRGNPVLWPARFFGALAELEGDVGARHLLAEHAAALCAVAIADDGVLIDVDTLEALERLRNRRG